MIVVPPSFVEELTRVTGSAGHRWLDELPSLVGSLCARWQLSLTPEPAMHGALGLVLPAVRAGGEPCVLKVAWQDETTADEALALRAWSGNGTALVLESDPSLGALLLERLDSSYRLRHLDLLPAAEIAGGLIRQLAIPAPSGFRQSGSIAAATAASVRSRNQALGGPIPVAWVDRIVGHGLELTEAASDVLVHADLHYDNVLAGRRQPWLAIDPKAATGDPELSLAELMWTRLDEAAGPMGVRRLLAVLVATGDLDLERGRAWVVVRAADYWLWGLEVGLTEDPVRCERLVSTFLG
ncbi:aminoglycoside phosphotransferase family protein [Flindersiella endophytica]